MGLGGVSVLGDVVTTVVEATLNFPNPPVFNGVAPAQGGRNIVTIQRLLVKVVNTAIQTEVR